MTIPDWLSPFGYSLLDHFEIRKDEDKNNMYFSHPYELSYEAIKNTFETCEKHGVKFEISGKSDHDPGAMKIRWYKPDSKTVSK
jgi:hypothetical protein